ncbi:MAG: LysM peptidoglycan-binding domain-containing protein [Actinobacteria bacterium]|nr:LysM peptidoglycan-binding domain-containing protein [Actinomycetota bacterium]
MAIRREDLGPRGEAVLLVFPTAYARRRAARQMRLVYLRRRLALLGVALLIVSGWLLAGGVADGSPVSSKDDSPRRLTLQAGETLWDVAVEHAPSAVDPRAYVDRLLAMNNIEGIPQAGQRLRLP